MASTRKTDWALSGLLLPDQRFTAALLSSADSSYTQAGPRAGGVATPSTGYAPAVLETLGDQDDTLVVEVIEGGYPGPTAAMTYNYRLSTEAATSRRGWNAPNLINRWQTIYYSTTASTKLDACVLADGKIFHAHISGGEIKTYKWDPTADNASDTTASFTATTYQTALAVCRQPSGHVLLLTNRSDIGWIVYRSDSTEVSTDGFDYHSLIPFTTTDAATIATGLRSRLLYVPATNEYAFINMEAGTIRQFASNDGASTFTSIGTLAPGGTMFGDAAITPGGRIGIGYIETATYDLRFVSIGSAYDLATSASSVLVDGGPFDECWVYTDPVGVLYLYARNASTERIDCYFSTDDGATWGELQDQLTITDTTFNATNWFTQGKILHSVGAGWFLHGWSSADSHSGASFAVARLGGPSNVVSRPVALTSTLGVLDDIPAWGSGNSTWWCAFDLPTTFTAWTLGSTAGSIVSGTLKINPAAAISYYQRSKTTVFTKLSTMFEFWVVSGGSLTTHDAGVSFTLNDGVNFQEVAIYATTTGFAVYDVQGAASLATVTVAMEDPYQFWILWEYGTSPGNCRIEVYYKRSTSNVWISAYQSTNPLGSAAGTASRIRMGSVAASTSDSRYRFLGAAYATTGPQWSSYASTDTGIRSLWAIGRAASATPAPLGDIAASGDRVTYLRATDGPGRYSDTYTVAPAYDYPATNIDCLASPSPRAKWRSTSTAEQIFAWTPDSTYDTGLGGRSMGIALFGINFESAALEGWDGATWVQLIDYSGKYRLAGLKYTRTGNMIRIDSGGTAASRTILRNELVGARVNLGSSKVRVIAAHTEGLWADTAGKHVELRLSGVDGTEPASGTLDIWPHSGFAVAHGISAIYDKYRVRIPTATTAEGYFEAGNIIVGEVMAFGTPTSWGSNYKYDPNAESFEDRSGTSRRRALGPVKPSWTVAWTDESDLTLLRAQTPDYFAHTSTTEGMANFGDAPWQLAGVIEELKSGEVPVVYMPNIPLTTSRSITDPSLFLYGRITSSVQIENVQGDEGEDEVHRVQSITIEGLV